MEKPAVVVDNVSMKFNLSKEKVDSLKDYVIKFLKKEIKYNEFWALQNVDFEVKKGDRSRRSWDLTEQEKVLCSK